jgi:serine/threonine-protein kinase
MPFDLGHALKGAQGLSSAAPMQLASLAPGHVIQETYEIVRRIGRGGMGEVYEAKHRRLAGRYAVKFLIEDFTGNDEAFARFRREAEVTSGIRHPNIVQVVDFNRTPEGLPYMVMEFLEGEELTEVIRRTAPMQARVVAGLVEQIASALEAAHARGIVHRDLKPQNLFLVPVEGRRDRLMKVMDFGISKVREATARLTREHVVMGTPQYMAPEQALGHVTEIDGRTDQFALAAIVYEMLAGKAAFGGDSLQSVLFQVVQVEPQPLTALIPGLDPAVGAVVSRGLAKRREDRFPSVLELATALSRAASGAPAPDPALSPPAQARIAQGSAGGTRVLPSAAGARPPSATTPAEEPRPRRRRWPAALIGAVVAATAGVAGWRVMRDAPAEEGHEGTGTTRAPLADPAGAAARSRAAVPAAETSREAAAAAQAAPPRPGPAETVTIELRQPPPPGLQVTVDGVLADLPLHLPRGSALRVLRFDAPGYDTFEVRVDGTQDRKLLLPMRKAAAAPGTAAGSPAARAAGARSPGGRRPDSARADGARPGGASEPRPARPEPARGSAPAASGAAPAPAPRTLITDF